MEEKGIEMLKADKIAGIMGVHPATVRRWLRDGTIPGVKVGRKWYIKKTDFEKLISSETKNP